MLVEFAVGKAWDGFCDTLYLNAEGAQFLEVRPENLDGHGRGDAAEHVADAVCQRSHDDAEGAGDALHFLPNVGKDLVAGALAFFIAEIHVELRRAHGHDVVAAFCTTETPPDFFHLRNGE